MKVNNPAFAMQLSALFQKKLPGFSGEKSCIQTLVEQGLIEKESGVALDPAQAEVFLCGNPEMVKTVKELLAVKGFSPSHGKTPGTIHVEEYW